LSRSRTSASRSDSNSDAKSPNLDSQSDSSSKEVDHSQSDDFPYVELEELAPPYGPCRLPEADEEAPPSYGPCRLPESDEEVRKMRSYSARRTSSESTSYASFALRNEAAASARPAASAWAWWSGW
jgi:hypothetical protein